MKRFATLSRLSFVATLLASSPVAFAETETPTRAYVGIGVGMSHFGYDSGKCARDTGLTCEIDNKDSTVKLYGGINVTPQAAIELSSYDLGSLTGTVGGLVQVTEEQSSLALSVVGGTDASQPLGFFARFGLHRTDLEASATGPGGSFSLSDNASGILFGLGLRADINRNVGVRAEWERLSEAGDAASDIDVLSASLRVMF